MANSLSDFGVSRVLKNGPPNTKQGATKVQPTKAQEMKSPERGARESAPPTLSTATASAVPTKTRATTKSRAQLGIPMPRHYTTPGVNPLDQVVYERRSSAITNPDGSIVFKMDGAEIPATWSQLATDIVISKYFRKAGLHGNKAKGETSVRQVVLRIARTIREAAEAFGGYFASKTEADTFEAELSFLLVNQYGAFNSPVWFNCGLWAQYGIEGSGGNFAWNFDTNEVFETKNAYERPQCSACFIQKVNDDLMGIYELMKSEARLFKYGSGTGSNFSAIRGKHEKLSGGGTSSGLMSFLEVFDRAAGATKSGGTTRRAAKMVCLDMDHPEIVDFINWKVREEKKAHALIAAGFSSDFNGEAYHTISGQNSNNSIRVTDEFMKAALAGGTWQTRQRLTGETQDTHQAKDLWKMVAEAAWGCADPGVQYDSTINRWHTCPNTDRINASNPCSEYMFLDDSACNLASVNLTKFLREDASGALSFDVDGYRHACRTFLVAQEILVDLSAYPTKDIARNSHDYRPLGLGYANLGSMLMLFGIPYDSDKGRAIAAALTAIMCGQAYKTSAEMAATTVRRFRKKPRTDASRDEHASRCGVCDSPRSVSNGPLSRSMRRLGHRGPPRRAARLPQCAVHRARANGNDRAFDGLRHDGHRARLRAREVQEARRWRLFQNRKPVGSRSAEASRLRTLRSAGDRRVRFRNEHTLDGASREPPHA
jgi:ribonucleoside-diphosphate reductase alpha chain